MKLMRSVLLLSAICPFLLLFGALTTPAALAAPAPSAAEALFQQGNDLYGQGKYHEALQMYTRIVAEAGFSGPLLYNLANCYAQTNQAGLAILNYQRALRLAPGDPDAQGNLDLLRKHLGLFQEELPWAQRLTALFDLDQWTLMGGVCLVLFTLVNLAGLRFATGTRWLRGLGGLCLLGMILAAAGIFTQYRQQAAAVVTSRDARLLLSPFPSAAAIETVKEGQVVVYQKTQHGSYSLVADQSGHTGWIETKAIAAIIIGIK